jgi:hypothetical protein
MKPVILTLVPLLLLLGCFEKSQTAAQPDIQGMVARQFHVDPDVVTVEYKPHDCEYFAAPIGKKYCDYLMHEDAKVNDFCLQAEYPKLNAIRPYQQGEKLFDSNAASYYREDTKESREDWYCSHNVGVKVVSVDVSWVKIRE